MSRTLFLYIFKDLLRIFLLALGGLAGIMSFGGIVRPLTEHGLNGAQIAQILTWFMPAMATYSLPVAALFATTMVYGRLSADNELTAIRAGGISYFSIATPALVLGLVVAMFSLLMLCFIVPAFMLRVEKVIYSNVAQMVASRIERSHQIRLEDITIFAQGAYIPPANRDDPSEQVVVLTGPMIVTYETPEGRSRRFRVPKEFWMARQATAYFRQNDEDDVWFHAVLEDGTKFPRTLAGGVQGGVTRQQFGPIPLESFVRENTKFMDIHRLKELYQNPGRSRRVSKPLRELVRRDQEAAFLQQIMDELNGPQRSATISTGTEQFILETGQGRAELRRHELIVSALGEPAAGAVKFRQMRNGVPGITVEADELRLSVKADDRAEHLAVTVAMHDALVHTGGDAIPRSSFPRTFFVAMPDQIRELENRPPQQYLAAGGNSRTLSHLRREMIKLNNSIQAEMHARASFSVSCLILVTVGCALGMMFKSGNFLSAFAVSVVPALITIALIISGQQTAGSVPWSLENFRDPLNIGLVLIWSGNAAVLVIGAVLLGRLQRQ